MRHIKKYDYSSQIKADLDSEILGKPYVAEYSDTIDWNSMTGNTDNFLSPLWVLGYGGQFSITINSTYPIYYSTDTGETKTWIPYSETITVPGLTQVFFKGNFTNNNGQKIFTTNGYYIIGGNIFSLVIGDDYLNENYIFTSTTDLLRDLFKGDTYLLNAGSLSMNFIYKIRKTVVAGFSPFHGIFSGCTSLGVAPSYVKYPENFGSTYNLFRGCTSLTTAPEMIIPNPSRISHLSNIFRGCSNLSSIKCLTVGQNLSASNWLSGVSGSGTFTKNKNSTWSSGVGGIPSGWTVVDSE